MPSKLPPSLPSTRRAAAMLLVMASLFPALAVRAADPEYALLVEPDSLRADSHGTWRMHVVLANRSATGAYPDSLHVLWTSDARGTDGAPATGRTDLSGLARAMGAVSAGEDGTVDLAMPAECSRGRATVRLWLHDSKDRVSNVSDEVTILGSDLDDRAPSLQISASGRASELVIVRPDSLAWPAPVVLVLPPAGVRARSLVRWSLGMVERGYTVALLGPPGTGGSQGPDDRSGPASVAAVDAALARLKREPAGDAKRTVLWGELEGATTALLAAAARKDLAGVVSMNARMDPWASYRAMDAPAREAYVAGAGRDSAAWRARSPLAVAARITPPVLVLHTDTGGPADAALQFVQARTAAGLPVESRLNGQDSRPLRRPDANRLWTDFVQRQTRATN
jgi:alpha/beta superfamily hydrolase